MAMPTGLIDIQGISHGGVCTLSDITRCKSVKTMFHSIQDDVTWSVQASVAGDEHLMVQVATR